MGHDHEEPKVKPLELFSDLVFVVALNVVAASLEEETSLMPGLAYYLLRIFLLWHLWHNGTVVVNLMYAVDDDGELNAVDYLMTFLTLGFSVFMARAVKTNDDQAFILFFLAARAVQLVAGVTRVAMRPKPEHLSERHYGQAKGLSVLLVFMTVVTEVAPLSVCIYFGWLRDSSGRDQEPRMEGLYAWSALPLVIWPLRILGGWKADADDAKAGRTQYDPVLDMTHLAERYELIILIFLGELIFAAATPGSWALSLSTIFTQCACFVLYFLARPRGAEQAWTRSAMGNLSNSGMHFFLFAALGGLGAAYALQVHLAAHAAEHAAKPHADAPPAAEHAAEPHAAHRALSPHASDETTRQECLADTMLLLSAGAFLLASSVLILNSSDPDGEDMPRIGRRSRVAIRAVAGVAMLSMQWALLVDGVCAPWPISLAVPSLMSAAALLELWGIVPVKGGGVALW